MKGTTSQLHLISAQEQRGLRFQGYFKTENYESRGPDSDAETFAFFAEHLGKIFKTREDAKTWFEFGELDDYVSFGGKA